MERQTSIRKIPFLTSMVTAKDLYAVDLTEDEFIETAYPVWRLIGNIATIEKEFITIVPEDLFISLPQDCEFVNAVVTPRGAPQQTHSDSSGPSSRQAREVSIPSTSNDLNSSLSSVEGTSVNYDRVEGGIKVHSSSLVNKELIVLYKKILVGEDGLPLLNDKEVSAIAAEVARRVTVRKAFQGVSVAKDMLGYITQEANTLMPAAKVDEYMSEDSLDKILDIKTSWDRKVYNRRFHLKK